MHASLAGDKPADRVSVPSHVKHLAVRDLPGSGTPQELVEAAGISAGQVAQAARELRRA
jgi:transketolase